MQRIGTLAIKTCCLLALGIGIVWNARLTVADSLAQRHQADDLRRAMRIEPSNGAYPAQLADELYASDPEAARSLLQTAVRLNPGDAASWIQLGLLFEAANQLTAAEQSLNRAAKADVTYLPSWSLANFYFRRQDNRQFWYWARRAAHMAPGDVASLFRLAWYVTPSVPVIEHQLQLQGSAIEPQFVSFLITQRDGNAVSEAATALLQSPEGVPSVLGASDWLIASKHPELALPLWNQLATHHRIPYAPLTPAHALTNGDFSATPSSLGFDWHMSAVDGISSFWNTSPNALGFELSGNEPDRFTLLRQTAPVEAGQTYALVVNYRSRDIPPGSGLAFAVDESRSAAPMGQTASLSAPEGGQTTLCFAIPKDTHFVDVSLRFQRPPGTVRPAGRLTLQQVRLSVATGKQCAETARAGLPDRGAS